MIIFPAVDVIYGAKSRFEFIDGHHFYNILAVWKNLDFKLRAEVTN